MKRYYITTAIDYVNSLPHIGTAYEKITADCIARARRLQGYDVRFCMGTDEHSINVKRRALEEGLDPKAYCDSMAPKFKQIWEKLDISYDDFIRTTESRHVTGVHELFKRILDAGDIYTADYKGWYCEGCEAFIQEKDLVEGKCPLHMKPPTWIEEQNYFFRLSKYGDFLLDRIRNNPDFIRPESRRNEIVRLIEGGLDDISVSRSGFDWGIPLPGDSTHVVYVWFDALINYISSLGFGGENDGDFDKYWPADLHIIGKDITRFHCVIWPAMLKSAGLELPKSVFGHGFIYHRGEKMSKSLGNVVHPLDVVDKYGADPLRYFLLREVVYGQDGDFTFERFIERYNSDLANDLGNLVSRTISMIGRYLDGVLPADAVLPENAVSGMFPDVLERWNAAIDRSELSIACDAAWDMVRAANRRVEESSPWKLAKDPSKRDELVSVLYDLATTLGGISVLLLPYMPETAAAIWKAAGHTGDITGVNLSELTGAPEMPKGVKLETPPALFPRIDSKTVNSTTPETKNMSTQASSNEPETTADTALEPEYATIDDFARLEIRIGTVTAAEPVKGSDKLMRLSIDDGRRRTHYSRRHCETLYAR